MAEANAFLEHAQVFDRRYGTGRARTLQALDAGEDIVLDIDSLESTLLATTIRTAMGEPALPPDIAKRVLPIDPSCRCGTA